MELEDLWTSAEWETDRLLKKGETIPEPRLSDALEIYLKLHPNGQKTTFKAEAERVFAPVDKILGTFR